MADTSVFEVARQTHEEAERYEAALADILFSPAHTHKDHMRRAHKASNLLDRIVSRNAFLDGFYRDANGERAKELEHIAAGTGAEASASSSSSAANPETDASMKEFYSRLSKIKDYHHKYPGALPDVFHLEFSALEGAGAVGSSINPAAAAAEAAAGIDFIDRMFSGEEAAGRFLDVYTHHDAFLNLKGVQRISYLQYLDDMDKVAGPASRVPDHVKRSDAYRKYLVDLQTYLFGFLRKTRPLSDVDALELTALATFEEEWEAGKVVGWEDKGEAILSSAAKGKNKAQAGAASQPVGEGIWCEACKRFYSKQTVYDAHLKSPKHEKAAAKLAKANGSGQNGAAEDAQTSELEKARREAKAKGIARDEAMVRAAAGELAALRAETRANVERRAALTDKERQAEAEAAAADEGDAANAVVDGGDANGAGDDDDEEKIYNPLKLPLGWDGKPIPFWLYKLHGLSVEFKCEICSDYVYQGRKNFERHFSESRHAFGMRALGLPNTRHFHEITKIEDALALADKLKKQGKQLAEEQGDAEEVEDEQGNTYTRKTYELLKRQGLI